MSLRGDHGTAAARAGVNLLPLLNAPVAVSPPEALAEQVCLYPLGEALFSKGATMEERILDSKGWPIVVDARIRRRQANGFPLKGRALVTKVYYDGKGRAVIDYEELLTLKRGTWLAAQCEVMQKTGATRGEARYKLEVELLSKAVQKKRGRRI